MHCVLDMTTTTRALSGDARPEVLHTRAPAQLTRGERGWTITYAEQAEGLEGCETRIALGEGAASVSREGIVQMRLEMAHGRACEGYMRVSGMDLALVTDAARVRMLHSERRLFARLEYELTMGGARSACTVVLRCAMEEP